MKEYLDHHYELFSGEDFIANDPISIPHRYRNKEDIEIAGFFAAIFSWGRRDIIILKSHELLELMDNRPHDFVLNYRKSDLEAIQSFKHRTFQPSDLDFYLRALQAHYRQHGSLEFAFSGQPHDLSITSHLTHFYDYITQIVPSDRRNLKHISTPLYNSSCKRLCMFLRWMVRKGDVDFGIWDSISPTQLIIPLDVHVLHIASKLKLIKETDKANWKTALALTNKLREYDVSDPVKYDFALFGMGINRNKT